MKKIDCVFVRFGYATKTIVEHGSPLHWNTQYSSHHNIHIKQIIPSRRAANDRPYRFVPTTTKLRSGGICFGVVQTIFTNWERRLAIWKFTNHHNATLGHNMFRHYKLSSRTGTAARSCDK